MRVLAALPAPFSLEQGPCDFTWENAVGYSLPNFKQSGLGWVAAKTGVVLSLKHNVVGEGAVFIFTSLNEGGAQS